MRLTIPLVRIFTRISSTVKSKFCFLEAPINLANSSAPIDPLWTSSSSKKALRTELKLAPSRFLISSSSCFTCSATFCCFREPVSDEPPIENSSPSVELRLSVKLALRSTSEESLTSIDLLSEWSSPELLLSCGSAPLELFGKKFLTN